MKNGDGAAGMGLNVGSERVYRKVERELVHCCVALYYDVPALLVGQVT
jgi:hypothetical protein